MLSLEEFHKENSRQRFTWRFGKKRTPLHIVHASTQDIVDAISQLYTQGREDSIPHLMWSTIQQRYIGD